MIGNMHNELNICSKYALYPMQGTPAGNDPPGSWFRYRWVWYHFLKIGPTLGNIIYDGNMKCF